MIKIQTQNKYITAYEALAKVYAKKTGVTLVCGGSSFLTDGETIIIPEIPKELNKTLKNPALAGLLHEGQHCVHSSFDKKLRKKIPKQFRGLTNNIEDIRIYELGKREYPGYQGLQETGLSFIKSHLILPCIDELVSNDMPTMVGGCLQYRASNMDDSFFPKKIRLLADIAEKELKKVKWLPREEGHEQSTIITQEILKKIKKFLEEAEEEAEEKTEEEETVSAIKEMLKEEDDHPFFSPEDDGTSLMELLEKHISKIIGQFKTENDKHVPYPEVLKYDREYKIKDLYSDLIRDEKEIRKLKNKYSKTKQMIDRESKKLKAKVLPLLLAEKRSSFILEQEEGILDEGSLFKIPNGDRKVYKKKVIGKKVDTAISILCDISGSMHGLKIEMLRATLIIMANTMFALKIPFEILTFTTDDYGERFKNYSDEKDISRIRNIYFSKTTKYGNIRKFNRFVPLEHCIVKSFNQNYLHQVKELIPLIKEARGNVDNESFDWAVKRLAERRELRKIQFVLSDGQPASSTCSSYLIAKDLKEKVTKAIKSGIEVIGIGILTSSSEHYYPESITIKREEEISIKIYEALLNKLKN